VLDVSPAFAYTLLLLLVRTSTMLVTAPLLSHRAIPPQLKAGFALFLALVLLPLDGKGLAEPPAQLGSLVVGVIHEVLFGLALGLAMNIVFMAMHMASRIIGFQVGFGIGGVIDPLTGADNGTFDQFYAVLVTLVFLTVNGHYVVIQALSETVRAVTPGTFDPLSMRPAALAPLAAGLFVTAVRVAMPVMAALFLADLGMGFVARTMPQINVLIVGMPVKVLLGVVVLGASLPVTVHLMNGVITSSLAGSSQQLLGVR
jgi:flagellar biosynthetic protein FliR